jgi:hypothetical protein
LSEQPKPETRAAISAALLGNQNALIHGARGFELHGPDSLPDERRADYDAFREGLFSDFGGSQRMTLLDRTKVERLAELDTLASLFMDDLKRRGILSARGRVRTSCELFLKVVDRFIRVASQLDGLDRPQSTQPSLDEFMAGDGDE